MQRYFFFKHNYVGVGCTLIDDLLFCYSRNDSGFFILNLQKALNLHHSVLAGRKINVEVTCGGGGKGEQRKKRLKERKTKFRQKRRQKSKTVKAESKQTQDSSSSVP